MIIRNLKSEIRNRRASRPGVALLEVVLGLSIFFMTALFVIDGLSSSLRAVQLAKLEADGADFACSVLSEVQIGARPIQNDNGLIDEENYPGWSWELVVEEPDDLSDYPLLKRVEVVVRYEPDRFVHRLIEFVQDDQAAEAGEGAP